MNGSESQEVQAVVTQQEIEFLQRYSWEQIHHLGHPDKSPVTAWLRKQGLTNLDVGQFILTIEELNSRVSLISEPPQTEFQSPWNNRDEFLNRTKLLAQVKKLTPSERTKHDT